MTKQVSETSLHWIDYVVFVVMLCISLGIGVFFAISGGKQKTTQEYLIGNRQMKILPVSISMLVSFVSAIGILGNPAEIYGFGTQLMLYVVATSLGCLLGVLLFVPLFYPLHLTSSFEYLRMRFESRAAEMAGVCLALLNQFLFNGIQLYGPSVALEAVSGFPIWASLILCGITATVYTTLGGMKAVIWTDVFQFLVITAGLLAILIQGSLQTGGLAEVWQYNADWDRIHFFDFNPDPTVRVSFGSVVVMNTFLWLATTASQPSVQRYCGLETLTKAKITVLLTIPGFIFLGLLTCLTGFVAFGYYARIGCDPWRAKYVTNPNQLLPYFVMDIFANTPGLPGLFIACLFSASLSSVSSSLAALAAIAWENGLKSRMGHVSPWQQATITKLLCLAFGILGIAVGFLVKQMGGTLVKITYSIMGTTAGPVAGMYILGATFPWAGPVGVVAGCFCGFAVTMWLALGAAVLNVHQVALPTPTYNCTTSAAGNVTFAGDIFATSVYTVDGVTTPAPIPPLSPDDVTGIERLYLMSYLWYPFIAVMVVYCVGALVSCIPGLGRKTPVPAKYLFPCLRGITCSSISQDDELDLNENEAMSHKPFLKKGSHEVNPDSKDGSLLKKTDVL